jgi:hypothetical protein
VVTRIEDTGVYVNNSPRVKLTLQVQPDGGVPFEVTKKMTLSRVDMPAIGGSFWVRYDPADKSKVEIDQAKNDEEGASATASDVTSAAAGTPGAAAALGGIPISSTTFTTTIDGGSMVIDARGVPGLRAELMKAVQDVQAGGDPAELREAVMKAMSQGTAINMPPGTAIPGGVIPGAGAMPGAAAIRGAAASAPSEDPLDRLDKLGELRKSGALTEAEFETMKKKILGDL